MLRFILLFTGALVLVGWVVWASGRRPTAIASAAITAGTLIAVIASLLVDCRLCRTGPLAVGTLMSVPFFGLGWIALALARSDGLPRGWMLPILAAASFQMLWAVPLVHASTVLGACPCMGLIFNGSATALGAIGIDRAVGPILVAEAMVSVWLAWKAHTAARATG